MRIQTYIQQYDGQCSEHTTNVIYETETNSYICIRKLARICDGEYVTEKVIFTERKANSEGKMTLCHR